MYVFMKLCCYALLSYRASAVNSPKYELIEVEDKNEPETVNCVHIKELWIEQDRDHFRHTDTSVWYQRYFLNKIHYKGDGPVFLMIGGQEEISVSEIQSGPWFEYARKTKALLLYLEHRYYGQSRPTRTLETNSLVFLTSEQALADLAWFIVRVQLEYPEDIPSTAKWIAFGGGTGGTLAARMRLKYPQYVHAAVTSSALLLETIHFSEFFKFVEDELDKYPGVKDQVRVAFQTIYTAIDSNQNEYLENQLKLCSALDENNEEKNVIFLLWNLTNHLVLALNDDNNDKLKKGEPTVMDTIAEVSTLTPLERLAAAIDIILENNGENCILVDYDQVIKIYNNTKWSPEIPLSYQLEKGFGNRQKLYQHCTEIGLFAISDQESSLFGPGMKIDFFGDICKDVFGLDLNVLNKGVTTNAFIYGGLSIAVSRAIFVNGGHDPRSKLSITQSKTDDRIAVYIEKAFYCEDLKFADDRPWIKEAQDQIFETLKNWLK